MSKPRIAGLWRRAALVLGIAALLLAPGLGAGGRTSAPLRFAVVTDTHVGAPDAAAGLKAIVEEINADPGIEFTILPGDITESGRDEDFAEAASILDGLKAPHHVLPGNHDLHWCGYGGAGFLRAFGKDRFFFEKGGAAFIGLSGWDTGHIAPYDLDWLEETVRGVPADAEVFLFVHYPPASIDNWIQAHNILRARRTTVVCGHVHSDQRLEAHGIPVVTIRAAVARTGEVPGFGILTDGPEGISVETAAIGKPPERFAWIPAAGRTLAPAIALAPPPALPGRVLWRQALRTRLNAALVTDGKNLFAADQFGRITAIDAAGRVRWTYQGQAAFLSRPAVHRGNLYAASADGRLCKLEASSGVLLASADLGERPTSQIAVFEDNQVKLPRLLVGTASGRLVCVNLYNLTPAWTSEAARGPIQTRPLTGEGQAVFGAWDGGAHAVDIETGRELWRWTEDKRLFYSPAGCVPAGTKGRVYFCCPDGFVSAVERGSGKTLWRVSCGSWESLALSGDGKTLFVKGRNDSFTLLEAVSGAVLRKIAPAQGNEDFFPVEPVEWEGRVLCGAANGRIYEIATDGKIRPIVDLGPGPVHSLVSLGKGRFAAANVDGVLALFEAPR